MDAGRLDADEVRAVKKFVESRRVDATGFDIIVGARERAADWEEERSIVRAVAEAGATWWIEWVPANEVDLMRRSIEHGPLRI